MKKESMQPDKQHIVLLICCIALLAGIIGVSVSMYVGQESQKQQILDQYTANLLDMRHCGSNLVGMNGSDNAGAFLEQRDTFIMTLGQLKASQLEADTYLDKLHTPNAIHLLNGLCLSYAKLPSTQQDFEEGSQDEIGKYVRLTMEILMDAQDDSLEHILGQIEDDPRTAQAIDGMQ